MLLRQEEEHGVESVKGKCRRPRCGELRNVSRGTPRAISEDPCRQHRQQRIGSGLAALTV